MILHWDHLSTFTAIHALLSFMNLGGLFFTLLPENNFWICHNYFLSSGAGDGSHQNDLSLGKHSVPCLSNPSFQPSQSGNRHVNSMTIMAKDLNLNSFSFTFLSLFFFLLLLFPLPLLSPPPSFLFSSSFPSFSLPLSPVPSLPLLSFPLLSSLLFFSSLF